MAEIFLMEDSRSLRSILTVDLRAAGHNVTSFENGEASTVPELVEGADLLVADLGMPVVDGIKAIENVRAFNRDLPVIVISGQLEQLPEELKVNASLRKPFESDELLRLIEQVLPAAQVPE